MVRVLRQPMPLWGVDHSSTIKLDGIYLYFLALFGNLSRSHSLVVVLEPIIWKHPPCHDWWMARVHLHQLHFRAVCQCHHALTKRRVLVQRCLPLFEFLLETARRVALDEL